MTIPIPNATVARLPRYLRFLEETRTRRPTVSSEDIGLGTGVTAVQVRKDLSHLGPMGTRGVGYDTVMLAGLIARALGLGEPLGVAIIGAGNLGAALANYKGFPDRGFRIVAMYDNDPRRIGSEVSSLTVRPFDSLAEDIESQPFPVAIAIIATPAGSAQAVADAVVSVGIRSILNFAPVVLRVAAGVAVRQVDLATELQILSYHRIRHPS